MKPRPVDLRKPDTQPKKVSHVSGCSPANHIQTGELSPQSLRGINGFICFSNLEKLSHSITMWVVYCSWHLLLSFHRYGGPSKFFSMSPSPSLSFVFHTLGQETSLVVFHDGCEAIRPCSMPVLAGTYFTYPDLSAFFPTTPCAVVQLVPCIGFIELPKQSITNQVA